MFSRFNTIPVCDGQADRQTSCDSMVRATPTHRAVKIHFLTNTQAYIYKLIRPCLCGPGTRQASVDASIFLGGQSTLWGRPRKSARRPFRGHILVYTV